MLNVSYLHSTWGKSIKLYYRRPANFETSGTKLQASAAQRVFVFRAQSPPTLRMFHFACLPNARNNWKDTRAQYR
jgi:hypothetical protein